MRQEQDQRTRTRAQSNGSVNAAARSEFSISLRSGRGHCQNLSGERRHALGSPPQGGEKARGSPERRQRLCVPNDFSATTERVPTPHGSETVKQAKAQSVRKGDWGKDRPAVPIVGGSRLLVSRQAPVFSRGKNEEQQSMKKYVQKMRGRCLPKAVRKCVARRRTKRSKDRRGVQGMVL